jgi:RND family efflux transporter MFP subunit
MTQQSLGTGRTQRLKTLFRFGLPLLVVMGGVLGARALIASRPPVPKASRAATPTLVEVLTVHTQDERAVITAFGTVRAHRELTVFPRAEGYVIAQHDDLITGGWIPAGERLFQIDPRDYRLAVDAEQGNLTRVEFELQVEHGNQVVARQEWDLLESSIQTSELGRLLALRKPHLKEKQAAVAAAKSRLAQAELDLKRTVVTTPCNALVLSEAVEVGQLVNARGAVATLVCTDSFRVEVSIPINQLDRIAFPAPSPSQVRSANERSAKDKPAKGSAVRIERDLGNGHTAEWTGWVARLLGDVTENGRMARLLVLVPDPLGREQGVKSRPPLLLGEYVRVEVLGPILSDVIVLPRSSLREGERVWVNNAHNQLEIRHVEVTLSRVDSVLISKGLLSGEQVVTSSLPAALPGMLLQPVKSGKE